MKKFAISILGIGLITGALYATENNHMMGMKGMDHSSMSKEHMKKCEAFMKENTSKKSTWKPPVNILEELYKPDPFAG